MNCPRCQHELPSGAELCPACGARFSVVCAHCTTLNAAEHRFCKKCGQPLGPTAEPFAAAKFFSPHAYTPQHLAEKILTSRSALEGERKLVTVLFADIKGSMELLADRDPEEARKILDPVLERMMEAVHRYEGTVNQVMGDGIMALFGAPLAHEDHAVRACYAALRMQESVKRYAEEVPRTVGVPIQIRVGLNSGEVVVRAIGSDLHMDYTAVGQTTHLAARMEQLADPGTVLLTPATFRLAEDFIQVRSLGSTFVKGLSEVFEVYELVGAHPGRSRFQAHATRGLTKFVGRTSELSQLGEALALARTGRGQVVAIVGEPGVGKSRLFWEFAHSHRTDSCLVIEGAGVSYGKATTYLPVIELLRRYFQIEPGDDMRKIRERVTGKLLSLDRALEPALPALLALLDVPVADEPWTRLDPPQRRQRTLEALKCLLLRESEVQPLIVVFEDLQWIDSETQALLDSLVESLTTLRVLLLVNYRREYQHGWAKKAHYTQARMDPLPRDSAESLLEAVLGNDPGLEQPKRLLIELAQGNPFFLEESVRLLVENQVFTGDRRAYRLSKDITSIRVAPTVQAVLASRIDRLPPEEKRLLQAAAVIGKDVPLALVRAITAHDDDTLFRRFTHLQAADFLYETRLFPEVEYTFKHALTQEVAYRSLLDGQRRALHSEIVAAVERLYADRLDEQVERLAHHAFSSEVWDHAVRYLRQAGAKAAARSALREAVTYFERALLSLEHLAKTPERIEQAIDIRFALKFALTPLGEYWRTFDLLHETEALAEALGDQRRLGRVSAYMSDYFRLVGEHESAVEAGYRALRIAETLRDPALAVPTNTYLGLVYYAQGAYRRASEFFRKNVDALLGERSRDRLDMPQLPSVHSRAWLGCCLAELGDFSDATATAEDGAEVAKSVDQPVSLAAGYFGVGNVYFRMGDALRAIAALERGLEICRQWNLHLWFPVTAAALGSAYALSGRVHEGLSHLEEAVERSTVMRRIGLHSIRLAALGEVYLSAGRVDEAVNLAHQALGLSRKHKERGNEAWSLRLLGEITSNPSVGVGGAQDYYREAMRLAGELGMRPLVAHCHLGLGRLHRRTGRRAVTEDHLTTATALFNAMGMRFWTAQSEAELTSLG
jgi:class 3 adenylate cyclase/tetratricopeptide (TPR) repeat protein